MCTSATECSKEKTGLAEIDVYLCIYTTCYCAALQRRQHILKNTISLLFANQCDIKVSCLLGISTH